MDIKGLFKHNSVQTGSQMNESLLTADHMKQQDELENLMSLPVNEQEETDRTDALEEHMLDANRDLIADGMKVLSMFIPDELDMGDQNSLDSAVGEPVLSSKARKKRFAQYSKILGTEKISTRRGKLQTLRDTL